MLHSSSTPILSVQMAQRLLKHQHFEAVLQNVANAPADRNGSIIIAGATPRKPTVVKHCSLRGSPRAPRPVHSFATSQSGRCFTTRASDTSITSALPSESSRPLEEAEIATYHRDGWLKVPGMFSEEEIETLLAAVVADTHVADHAMEMLDAEGLRSKVTLWNDVGDDVYGMAARSARMVEAVQTLTGKADIYHFHTKIMLKEPKVGGAWNWHQDFGYWYQVGCLDAESMLTAFIALDPAVVENGCLQVLTGSHKFGRIDHTTAGEQAGANLQRVEQVLERCQRDYAIMAPGDVFFLHSNTLHTSAPNRSDKWRRALLHAFNTKDNNPWEGTICPLYSPLNKVPDGALLATGAVGLSASGRAAGKDGSFLDHEANVKQFSSGAA